MIKILTLHRTRSQGDILFTFNVFTLLKWFSLVFRVNVCVKVYSICHPPCYRDSITVCLCRSNTLFLFHFSGCKLSFKTSRLREVLNLLLPVHLNKNQITNHHSVLLYCECTAVQHTAPLSVCSVPVKLRHTHPHTPSVEEPVQ